MIGVMIPVEEEVDSNKKLSMVDEALVAGTIANTNGLLVILAKLVAKGVFDRSDLQSFSDSYSKPLDHVGMRENELVTQMQDQMESTLAELMRYLSIVHSQVDRVATEDLTLGGQSIQAGDFVIMNLPAGNWDAGHGAAAVRSAR